MYFEIEQPPENKEVSPEVEQPPENKEVSPEKQLGACEEMWEYDRSFDQDEQKIEQPPENKEVSPEITFSDEANVPMLAVETIFPHEVEQPSLIPETIFPHEVEQPSLIQETIFPHEVEQPSLIPEEERRRCQILESRLDEQRRKNKVIPTKKYKKQSKAKITEAYLKKYNKRNVASLRKRLVKWKARTGCNTVSITLLEGNIIYSGPPELEKFGRIKKVRKAFLGLLPKPKPESYHYDIKKGWEEASINAKRKMVVDIITHQLHHHFVTLKCTTTSQCLHFRYLEHFKSYY